MRNLILPLLYYFPLFLLGCETPPPAPKNDAFFNKSLVESILDVEEAKRQEYFNKQYIGKTINGKGELVSIHEAMITNPSFKYGPYEALVDDADVFRDVDVEYRLYITEEEQKTLIHKRGNLRFAGEIKKLEWGREESNREIRVYLTATQIYPD